MLFGCDDETGVFQLHRAGFGGQSFLSEIPSQVAEESAKSSFQKRTIMRIVFERDLVTEAFGFAIGHYRFVVDPSRQLSNPVESRAEDMTQGLIPALVQQLADRLESERLQARCGFWTDPWQCAQRPQRLEFLFRTR